MALGLVKANKERVHDEIRSSLTNSVPKLGTGFGPTHLSSAEPEVLDRFQRPACVLVAPEISECGEVHCDHARLSWRGHGTTYDAATFSGT